MIAPMPVTARVQLLSDGQARLETMKIGLDAGPTAVLTWDNFTVVVFSKTLSLFDRAMYFANGLNPQGQNLYLETASSGAPQVGAPGSNALGSIKQGFVEASNVNVVEELVDMIETQRAYEVNSKMIQATDEMMKNAAQTL